MAERTLQAKLKVRSDTATNWQSNNPVLLRGEPALETDTNKLKFGDGTSAYNDLPYVINSDNIVDVGAVAGLPAPATGQVSLTVSEEIASRIRDNEDSIIKVRLLIPGSTSEGTVIYLRRNTNMWVDVSQPMEFWSCMLDVSMYEGHEVVAISYVAAFNPSSDAPTLGIQAVEIRNGAKVVDIGQISLNFMETGDASVNITNEQYDALEDVDRTILKFSTSDGQNIYLNSFCLGNGIIYSAMIAEGGIVAAYTANIGGSSQKTVAIRASAVYGSTEGNIATVIDIGTVANFSPAEEGNWTVNISDEMYSKITAPSQETTQIKIADASGNVAYLTRYVDNDGSLIFVSTYTDASQATLIQLFADVRGSLGNYKIEIACTMPLLGGGGVEVVDLGTPTFQTAEPGIQATVALTSEQAEKLAAEPAPVVKFTLSGQGPDYQNGIYYLDKSFKMGVAIQFYTLPFLLNGGTGWTISVQATSSQAFIAIIPYTLPQEVKANPSDSTSTTLEKLKVGDVTYAIPQGGGTDNGIPSGGLAGQALTKQSGTDYDVAWTTINATEPTVITEEAYAEALEAGTIEDDKLYYIQGTSDNTLNVSQTAEATTYDNATSGLTATTVQAAIDEVKADIPANGDFTLAGLSEKSYNNLTHKPTIPTVDLSSIATALGLTTAQLNNLITFAKSITSADTSGTTVNNEYTAQSFDTTA